MISPSSISINYSTKFISKLPEMRYPKNMDSFNTADDGRLTADGGRLTADGGR